MRKSYLILSILAIIISSCSKNTDSNGPKVVIKGTISTQKSSTLKSGTILSLADARKVLVFNSNSYSVYNIGEDGSFTAEAESGTACAISFLDGNNRFIGCLQAGGLNVLPLVSLKNGDKTIIDLSTLSLEGTNVIPANNPIGNEIGLNNQEIEWYKEIGIYYESLSKNIDVDNDGVIDIISHKNIRVSSTFTCYAGKWGVNDIAPLPKDISNISMGYAMRISLGNAFHPSAASAVTLSGPKAQSYSDIRQLRHDDSHDCFMVYFNRSGHELSDFLPFGKGEYTLSIDGTAYTINYATVCPLMYLIMAEPTIHTNSNNEVEYFSLEYKRLDGSIVNPNNFIYLVQLQIIANNQSCNMGASLYSDQNPAETEKYKFVPNQTIQLSNIYQIDAYYQDLLGNEYNILWRNQ